MNSNLWPRLTEPHASIPEAERPRARLTSALSLTLLAVSAAAIAAQLWLGSPFSDMGIMLAAMAVLSCAYGFSRSPRAAAAAWFLLFALFTAPLSIGFINRDLLSLNFLCFAVITASQVASFRRTVLTYLFALFAPIAFSVFHPQTPIGGILNSLFLIGAVGALALLSAYLRRRAEAQIGERSAALAESEGKYRSLVDHALTGVYQTDLEGSVLFVNPELARMLGFDSPQEMIGTKALGRYKNPQDRTRLLDILKRDGSIRNFDAELLTRDGQTRAVLMSAALEDGKLAGVVRDITDRKQAEDERARLAQRLQAILDSTGEGIYGLDLEGRLTFINETGAAIFGERAGELIGIGGHAHHHHTRPNGTPYPREECPIYAAFRDGATHRVDDEVFWRADGSSFPVEYISTPLRDGGKIGGAVVTFKDITERKQAEEQLRASEEKFSSVFQRAPILMTVADLASGLLVDVNDTFVQVSGFSRAEAIGKTSVELGWVAAEDRQRLVQIIQTQGRVAELEINVRGKDRRPITCLCNAEIIALNGKPHLLVAAVDITGRKRDETRIQNITRLYATLSQVNQAIVRAKDRDELFHSICNVAVDYGKFGLTWVGLVDLESGNVTPTAVHGAARERLPFDTINFKESPFKEGLIGEAVRTGEITYTRDIQTDPAMQHWRALAVEADYHAAAVIPFRVEGAILGFFKLYAGDANDFDDEEQHALLVEIGQDISFALDGMERERKKTEAEAALRESEERFAGAFRSSPVAIAITHLQDGTFVDVNESACRLFGYSREELAGQTSLGLGIIDAAARQKYIDTLREKGAVRNLETHIFTRAGEKRDILFSLESLKIGGASFVLSTFIDITERKQSEADRLAREVAEKASRAKSDFLSRMSHEFRTPLNAILGFAQLLQMDKLEPKQKRGVDQIHKSGRHLLDLVNEALDISRIEAGRMQISPEQILLADAANEALDLVRPMAEARRLSLTLQIPSSSDVFVLADRQRLKQVLLNLLSNAVKYNREGGAIDVVASLTISGYLRLQVKDEGGGIPPEKMERLFVPFDRLDLENMEEGTGLGLALSKGLVEAMGGRIGVESRVGEGSAFWIELKLVTERLKEVIMAEVEENLTERMKQGRGVVLYVEDNLANVHLVEAIMDRLPGVKLITAMQGRLALDLAKDNHPDLVLLDLHLPDIHGSEVLRGLRAEPATQSIPVVIISADAMTPHIHEALEQGAAAYLTKPIDVREFLQVVEAHIAK